MTTALFHPGMMRALGNFFPSLCTIQESVITPDPDSGEETHVWTAVPGLESVPCVVAAFMPTGEQRQEGFTLERASHRILLQGHTTAIVVEMRAVVDEDVFNILAVEADSHKTMTRLTVEAVEL